MEKRAGGGSNIPF
jgi:hypothetical protein